MALTFLYRLNGGEVLGVSTSGTAYSAIDTTYFATVDDPPTPDGSDLATPKILASATVRNATGGEIANFVTAKDADDNLIDRQAAKDSIETRKTTRKYLRALIEVLLDEVNTLRALHSLSARTIDQAKTAILNKIDAGNFD